MSIPNFVVLIRLRARNLVFINPILSELNYQGRRLHRALFELSVLKKCKLLQVGAKIVNQIFNGGLINIEVARFEQLTVNNNVYSSIIGYELQQYLVALFCCVC